MPQYRIEVSPNNRAGCKDSVCKANQAKITKGELRFGTWVEIQEHGSWSWKHWGCVSGSQMTKLREACEQDGDKYDFDVIDGYDELGQHPELQEKIRRCVKQGHIDAKDFKGDPEKNRPGEKGIHLTAKQKAAKEEQEPSEDEATSKKKKKKSDSASTKRGRKKSQAQEEDEEEDESEELPAPKKAKTSRSSGGTAKAGKASDKATVAKVKKAAETPKSKAAETTKSKAAETTKSKAAETTKSKAAETTKSKAAASTKARHKTEGESQSAGTTAKTSQKTKPAKAAATKKAAEAPPAAKKKTKGEEAASGEKRGRGRPRKT